MACALPKKKVRERARRRGDLVACAAAALFGWTGLSGGVSASKSFCKTPVEVRAEEETKVGGETKRALEDVEEEPGANVQMAEVAGEEVVLR